MQPVLTCVISPGGHLSFHCNVNVSQAVRAAPLGALLNKFTTPETQQNTKAMMLIKYDFYDFVFFLFFLI